MVDNNHCFHFTLGPVQGFVAQARRTRDFWAGSFLLSWLSGVAMAATEKLGGMIKFPEPPGGYLGWINGEGKGEPPRQGAIPNRFKASVPADFGGKLVAKAVRRAWQSLAETVWEKDLAPILTSEERDRVRAVWDRQHRHFWEITWVVTSNEAESNLLDRRKNWRNHLPPAEPGRKCMIMEGWQELSGIEGMSDSDNEQRRKFWREINARCTDLRENEMLCAMAFVKRRFVRWFGDFAAEIPLEDRTTIRIQGWPLKSNSPSVAYMAAVHWLETLLEHADRAELEALFEAARDAGADCGEWDTRIRCLDRALQKNKLYPEGRKFISLDGNLFFDTAQRQPERYGLNEKVGEVKRLLADFGDSKENFARAVLSPFYAVLLMDGDRLGVHMGNPDNQEKIATALNRFTTDVPGIVEENNGFLIYAGGDDVLALLPLEDALACAAALRRKYLECFESSGIPTTLSGAVIYAHVKVALGEVLHQAHHVLDDIAKDGAGRDAIAVRVLKPGGEHLTWAQPWKIALKNGTVEIAHLADLFQKAESSQEPGQFSSKFFYRMRERFTVLQGLDSHQAAANVLAADYIASGPARESGKAATLACAKEIVGPLFDQCRPVVRTADIDDPVQWTRKKPEADGALLVRFLAQKGVERR